MKPVRRPHLVIEPKIEAVAANRGPIPRGDKTPERNRKLHAQRLLGQVESLENLSAQESGRRGDLGFKHLNGLLVTVSGEPGYVLPVESLESKREDVQLVSVRNEDEKTVATVFFPDGSISSLRKKIDQYEKENVKPKEPDSPPKNNKLVSSIRDIGLRTLRAAWCDADEECPGGGEQCRFELWLRSGDEPVRFQAALQQEALRARFRLSPNFLEFQDYIVVVAATTLEQLANSALFSQAIAEIRKAQEPADFFSRMPSRDQKDWNADLGPRIKATPNRCRLTILDSGITSGHPLLENFISRNDCHSVQESWGIHDTHQHGTLQAGLALYGDLTGPLSNLDSIIIDHSLESVKLIAPADSAEQNENFGLETQQAVALVEIERPNFPQRVFCLSVTGKKIPDQGRPTGWSSSIDRLCFDSNRLFLICAGNRSRHRVAEARSEMLDQVQDPGQAWNALTVGAYTRKVQLAPELAEFGRALAPAGALCPSSTTSEGWRPGYPFKPDIVMEGGNYYLHSEHPPDTPDCLQLLSTSPLGHAGRLFATHGDTSASVALASRLAARIWSQYPNLRAESVRGLLVHSARWQPQMKKDAPDIETLLRQCGYGVPNPNKALHSLGHSATMVYEGNLQVCKSKSPIVLHALPWPTDFLLELGALPLKLRVTLSYFVEPRPGPKISEGRHSYHSHKLRFSLKRPGETSRRFAERVATQFVDQNTAGWQLGHLRYKLGAHRDLWSGRAADLASRGSIAVWPTLGWWAKNTGPDQREARYSLILSLESEKEDIDLYSAVSSAIAVSQQTSVDVDIGT